MSQYYLSSDLFVGACVNFNSHIFVLIDADEYAFRYMEQNSGVRTFSFILISMITHCVTKYYATISYFCCLVPQSQYQCHFAKASQCSWRQSRWSPLILYEKWSQWLWMPRVWPAGLSSPPSWPQCQRPRNHDSGTALQPANTGRCHRLPETGSHCPGTTQKTKLWRIRKIVRGLYAEWHQQVCSFTQWAMHAHLYVAVIFLNSLSDDKIL